MKTDGASRLIGLKSEVPGTTKPTPWSRWNGWNCPPLANTRLKPGA